MKRAWAASVLTAMMAAVVAVVGLPAAAAAAKEPAHTELYLVLLARSPLATYDGGISGYPATAPQNGERFNADRPEVRRYRQYLLDGQQRVLDQLGNPHKVYSYTTAVNGFAAKLSLEQVKQLRHAHGVLTVEQSRMVHLQQAHTADPTDPADPADENSNDADALNLTGKHGAWQRVGGPQEAGEGVVIGVVGSGIWPNNPSFAGIPNDQASLHRAVPGFTGTCAAGESWKADGCDSKVVAAQYFVKGFGADNVARADYLSPRDSQGHGSRVAAVAAGNNGVDVHISGQDFGHISGMAPAAKLSIYKACWTAPNPSGDGCTTADTLKAIDQAVADGVDVLNYSIGQRVNDVTSPISLAFMHATSAGVFVVAAAGNGGPHPGTAVHNAPWVTTVGASTFDRLQGSIRLGNGHSYVGAMLSGHSVGPTRLVYAANAAAPGVSPERARVCHYGSLDASIVHDAIVVCDRGSNARIAKSKAVRLAGGAGMVLVNISRSGTYADSHAVPTVHLSANAGQAVKAYVAKAGADATGSINAAATSHPAVPEVVGFSGRGPARATDGEVLKPDLTAPGAGVIAATSQAVTGKMWSPGSGTSLAAAHVAGLAAFLSGAHPSWTPMMIKSALMTTATSVAGKSDGPFDQGAGMPDAKAALQPGLVYSSKHMPWKSFLRAAGLTYTDGRPVAQRSLDASQLNLPSLAIGDLLATQTVTRRVTNIGDHAEKFVAKIKGLPGVDASIQPHTLRLRPGESKSFDITFTATKKADYGRYSTGRLTWTGNRGHTVNTPIAVRPLLVSGPTDVTSSGRQGSLHISSTPGVTGTLHPQAVGLVAAEPAQLDLAPGSFDPKNPHPSASTAERTFTVTKDTTVARFVAGAQRQGADVDLYVYRGKRLVQAEVGDGASEVVTLASPRPGEYHVYVTADSVGDSGTSSVQLTGWVVPGSSTGNLNVSPQPVTVTGGDAFRLKVHWQGLDPSKRWLGYISYRDAPYRTYVTIN